jgi:uncharacterized protein (DUF488 family)
VLSKSRFARYAPSLSAITQILTIGHSTHELEGFLDLLRERGVETLADVRRYPGSRRMPWFGAGPLAAALGTTGIEYMHLPELGGRRDPLPGSPNAGWRVRQFQGYADHMASDEFAAGLGRLEAGVRERRTAVMCAEAQWWRCHRRLLSDALLVRGWEVVHLDGRGGADPHALTKFAVVDGQRVTYPAAQAALDVPPLGSVATASRRRLRPLSPRRSRSDSSAG